MRCYSQKKTKGYTLIEVILALTILAAGVLGVYMMLKPASINAGIEQEQKQLTSLVTGVRAGFGTTQGSFDGLTLQSARNLKLTGVNFSGNTLVSALGDNIVLRPATVFQANDGFDAVYQNLNSQKCIAYVKAFSPQTYTILVDTTQTQVQTTTGVNEGRLVGTDTIVQACNSNNFKSEQGQVVFRFYQPSSKSVVAVENVCSCSPRTQTRQLDCSSGQAGAITQQRTSTCSGGTTACPTEVWSAWSTSSNTCSGGSPSGGTNVNVTEGDNTCIPTTQERTQACPSGYNGSIIEQRTSTCANATAVPSWSSWTVTNNTCVVDTTETYSCTPSVQTRNLACPSPYLGSIEQERSSTCASATATPTWGAWVEQGRNCSIVCVPGQTCCQPMPDQDRTVSCNAGFYGTVYEERSSYCASATSPLAWNSWYQTGTTCAACPAPLTQNQTQWVARTNSCPADTIAGTYTYEAQQERSRIRTYDCNPSPAALPAPDYTSWTSWSDTGTTRNSTQASSCPSSDCVIPAGTARTWNVGGNTCQGPALGSTVTIATGTSRSWSDSNAPTTGTASFQCTNAVLSATPNSGATCSAPSTDVCDGSYTYISSSTVEDYNAFMGVTYTVNGVSYSCSMQARDLPNGASQDWTTACASGFFDRVSDWEAVAKPGDYYEANGDDGCCQMGTGSPVNYTTVTHEKWVMPALPSPTSAPTTRTRTPTSGNGGLQTVSCQSVHGGAASDWTGNVVQERTVTENGTQTTTMTCPGPTSNTTDTWLGTYTYGSWVNKTDTCVSTACVVPSGTTRSWSVGGNACNGPGLSSSVTIANGNTHTWSDTTDPTTGQANFTCTNTVLSTTANAGATCGLVCTAPSPTTASTTRNITPTTGNAGLRTLSCQSVYGGSASDWTGDIDQSRTVTESGTTTTSWSCPGPTSSNSTAWSGSYTYGSWVTTSDTCSSIACPVAPAPSTQNRDCASGQYGSWTQSNPFESVAYPTCWSQTSNTWTPSSAPAGACTSCPANATVVEKRWDPTKRSAACPSGYTGSHTWDAEQSRNKTTSYSCPAGTKTLPAPGVAYTSYVDTGVIRNEVNTCTITYPPSEVCPAGQHYVGSGWRLTEGWTGMEASCQGDVWIDRFANPGPPPSGMPTEADEVYYQTYGLLSNYGCVSEHVVGDLGWYPRGSCVANTEPPPTPVPGAWDLDVIAGAYYGCGSGGLPLPPKPTTACNKGDSLPLSNGWMDNSYCDGGSKNYGHWICR